MIPIFCLQVALRLLLSLVGTVQDCVLWCRLLPYDVATRQARGNTNLELDREEPVDDVRARLLPGPSLRTALLDLPLDDLLPPFLVSSFQPWKSRSSSVSRWRLGRLPEVLDERR